MKINHGGCMQRADYIITSQLFCLLNFILLCLLNSNQLENGPDFLINHDYPPHPPPHTHTQSHPHIHPPTHTHTHTHTNIHMRVCVCVRTCNVSPSINNLHLQKNGTSLSVIQIRIPWQYIHNI